MRTAVEDLGLERLYVVHTGQHAFSLGERIQAVPSSALRDLATKLR